MSTIGIIALSGEVNTDLVLKAKKNFEDMGYNVKLSSNIFKSNRYLAGDDKEKINELHKFFLDDEIDFLIAARGGYGAIRLVDFINYDLIKNNPKIICGYSDVTALLLMIYKKTGLITFHGPMATSDFSTNISQFTLDNFKKAINNQPLEFISDKIYKSGIAKGIIWGGNLATVVSLCGLDFIPENEFIFFAEDINEPVYKIDKMFQQLINIKRFRDNCKGIVLGEFLNVDNEKWLDEYFHELAERLQIPICTGFKITHAQDKITIPIGKMSILKDNQLVIE